MGHDRSTFEQSLACFHPCDSSLEFGLVPFHHVSCDVSSKQNRRCCLGAHVETPLVMGFKLGGKVTGPGPFWRLHYLSLITCHDDFKCGND